MLRMIRPGQSLRERRGLHNRRLGHHHHQHQLLAADSEYRCCLCLHVKTGTLMLGLWQVWVQLFIVSFLMAVVINPNLLACMRQRANGGGAAAAATATADGLTTVSTNNVLGLNNDKNNKNSLADGYSNGDPLIGDSHHNHHGHHYHHGGRFRSGEMRRQDNALLLLIGIVSLLLALLMVAGALKERAKYIMPYFCMQLFDFIINCLTVVGYFSYLPDVKRWLTNHHWPHDTQVRKFLLGLDDATLGFLMLIICMLYLMLKAYLLGMVWACYKYLVRKETGQLVDPGSSESAAAAAAVAAAAAAEEFDFDSVNDWEASTALLLGPGAHDLATPATYCPPKYEDALKTPANLNAPPPYFPGRPAATDDADAAANRNNNNNNNDSNDNARNE